MKNVLSITNVSREFESKGSSILALENINMEVKEGEVLAVIGPSGCGKSTLLNIISGLDEPSKGSLSFSKEKPIISYMLQSDALLSWRSILDNATIGLELKKKKTDENIEKVKQMLIDYGLEEFIDKKPTSLSGGMKQRVALVRSLAVEPDLLLLDEPFSALDYYTRLSISDYVQKMIKRNGKTAIIITHDIAEAISIADRVAVMSSRPSKIKNIYEIDLPATSVRERRCAPGFSELFDKIWRDLDEEI